MTAEEIDRLRDRLARLEAAALRFERAAERSVWECKYVDADYLPARDALRALLGGRAG